MLRCACHTCFIRIFMLKSASKEYVTLQLEQPIGWIMLLMYHYFLTYPAQNLLHMGLIADGFLHVEISQVRLCMSLVDARRVKTLPCMSLVAHMTVRISKAEFTLHLPMQMVGNTTTAIPGNGLESDEYISQAQVPVFLIPVHSCTLITRSFQKQQEFEFAMKWVFSLSMLLSYPSAKPLIR